jgi:hypothetical protein
MGGRDGNILTDPAQARKGKVEETQLSAFVLDRRKRPVMPCCENKARLLVERGRAPMDRRYPVTIRFKDRVEEADRTRFPSHSCMRTKSVRGLETGERAGVPTGKKAGTHVGRVAVRGGGCFNYCKLFDRAGGHCYARQPALAPRPEERGFQRRRL